MRALVIGAGGFVGPHLARHLLTRGDEVVTAGIHASGLDVEHHELDITDPEACPQLVRDTNPDAVYHLAAASHVQAAPALLYRVNVTGSVHVLQAVHDHARRARVLLPSSAYVYGPVPPREQPIREDRALAPANHYGSSKAAMEFAGRAFAAAGLHVVVARSFNHTGPGQTPAFLVPSLAAQVVAVERGQAKRLEAGSTHPVRDFLDVRDVVRAYRLLVEKAPRGAVANVCSGRGVSVGEIAQRLCAIAGVEAEIATDPARVRGASEVDALVGDNTRLQDLTGWSPQVGLDATLKDVLEAVRLG